MQLNVSDVTTVSTPVRRPTRVNPASIVPMARALRRSHVPVSCRHCEGTPCLQDCPADAIMRDANGVVQIDAKNVSAAATAPNSALFKVIFMVEPPQPNDILGQLHAYRRLLASPKGGGARRRASDRSPSNVICVLILLVGRPVYGIVQQRRPYGSKASTCPLQSQNGSSGVKYCQPSAPT